MDISDKLKIIACNKGDAAKTTTAVNVAIGLALQGHDVCLVDADAQRSASRWYAVREQADMSPTLTLIEKREARSEKREARSEKRDNISQTLRNLDQKYSHVIVDVAGRNSRELITGGTVAHQIICTSSDLI
ncbi:hypothetical protein AV903_21415 [Erwinia tracheiphila]|uniref:AAA domain-containing protein n=1 Tax=Erwinia tracheiphila TaxID=65700 RepID=A0A345CZL4_9GAMM|nr:hypothetical protein AV903_21415 [Erwinia tracheiphila]